MLTRSKLYSDHFCYVHVNMFIFTIRLNFRTDELIQQTIRSKFADCTVLTIAHRLNTIVDYDRILVIDAGKCVEFDKPYNLLTKNSGYFKEMVQAHGNKEFERFLEISKSKLE